MVVTTVWIRRVARRWCGWGSWKEWGSLFQRWGAACWKEQFVILTDEEVGGLKMVTTDEDRVLRGNWTETSLKRYICWEIEACTQYVHWLLASADLRTGVMCENLTDLSAVRAREFWICWSRLKYRNYSWNQSVWSMLLWLLLVCFNMVTTYCKCYDWWVWRACQPCLYAYVSVCSHAYLNNHTSKLHIILSAGYLWS